MLRPTFDASGGRDGFVSFECTPDLADNAEATIEQGMDLWNRLARPNTMIKVPATAAGLTAIEELTARGVNVNVTLLFSVARYEQVIDAYMRGLERRVASGKAVNAIASVASFFVSRVDTKVDELLPLDSSLRGRVAVANTSRVRALPRPLRWRIAGSRSVTLEGTRNDRSGRVPAPRMPPTRMFSTWRAHRPRHRQHHARGDPSALADHGTVEQIVSVADDAISILAERALRASTSTPSPTGSSATAFARFAIRTGNY